MPSIADIQNALCDSLKGHDVKEAYLFGSYARGDQTEESDIDLRFLCGDSLRIQELDQIERAMEERLGVSLEIVSAPPEELRPRFYDIDLRFLCGDSLRIQELDQIERAMEERLGVSLEIVSAPPEELRPRFYDRIKREEVLLFAS